MKNSIPRRLAKAKGISDISLQSSAMAQLMIDSIRDYAVFMLDPIGNVLSWNIGAERIMGYLAADIIGSHFSCFYPADSRGDEPQKALETAGQNHSYGEEGWLLKKDGGCFWGSVVIEPVFRAAGDILGYAAVIRDTSERRAALEALRIANEELERRVEERTRKLNLLNSQLERLAVTDSLTGIFNRGGFTEAAAHEMKRSARYKKPFSVLFIDVDRFKEINDTFGHAAGDTALQMVVSQMGEQLRSGDIMARLGGDEFVLLLLETASEQAVLVAERLCRKVAVAKIEVDGTVFSTMVSVGVAQWTPHETINDLLCRADTALYNAKKGLARGGVVAAGVARS